MSVCEKIEFKDYFRIRQCGLDNVRASWSNSLATNSGINAWINKPSFKDRYFFNVKIYGISTSVKSVDYAYVDVPCICVNHSLMLFVGGRKKTLLVYHKERSIH
jgi:hypothetical protein